MRRISSVIWLSCLLLAGCVSQETVKKSAEYGRLHEVIRTQYGEFWVYEHPSGTRLAVTSTMGGALAQGVAKGLTFGAGNILPSEGAYQEAAEAYLKKHKALNPCRVTNGYLLQEPIYEFVLDCAPQPAIIASVPVASVPAPQRFSPTRDPLVGICQCPYDLMRSGRRCGSRSAYSRPGGDAPICYN